MKHMYISPRGFSIRAGFLGRQYYFGEYQHQSIAQPLAQEIDDIRERAIKKARAEFEAETEKARKKAKTQAEILQSSDGISRRRRPAL